MRISNILASLPTIAMSIVLWQRCQSASSFLERISSLLLFMLCSLLSAFILSRKNSLRLRNLVIGDWDETPAARPVGDRPEEDLSAMDCFIKNVI
jgi:hypothetical protein